MIYMIAAIDKNGALADSKGIPWLGKQAIDMAHFRSTTKSKTVVVGRKTFETFQEPLQGRKHIVITKNPHPPSPGVVYTSDIEAVIKHGASQDMYVIGGGAVYSIFLPYAQQIHLTIIDTVIHGAVFFPPIDMSRWIIEKTQHYSKNESNLFDCDITLLKRTKPLK